MSNCGDINCCAQDDFKELNYEAFNGTYGDERAREAYDAFACALIAAKDCKQSPCRFDDLPNYVKFGWLQAADLIWNKAQHHFAPHLIQPEATHD